MNKVLCILFGHIWTKKDGKYVCARCGATQKGKK